MYIYSVHSRVCIDIVYTAECTVYSEYCAQIVGKLPTILLPAMGTLSAVQYCILRNVLLVIKIGVRKEKLMTTNWSIGQLLSLNIST